MSLDISLFMKVDTGDKDLTHLTLWDGNITHNLTDMADAAGIYGIVWRPEENDITCAGDIVEKLTSGLDDMKANPKKYEAFNASNGWGLYEHFVPFIQEYLDACRRHPKASIHTWR